MSLSLAATLPRISTNVRFAASALLFPELAGAWAERLFLTPPKPRLDEHLLDFVDARAGFFVHRGRSIATWQWGWRSNDAPAVLLAHGWGGHAAQLRGFVYPLLSAGYRVIAFDQPAHGFSEGRLTGLTDFADVLSEVAWQDGAVRAVVAHSLGAAATALALSRGLRLERAVLIGASLDVAAYARQFERFYGIPERIGRAMQALVEERFGVRWSELSMARLAPALKARALVIQDRDDRIVPWQKGLEFARAWPGARLLATQGLGHRRILDDERVARLAADFVSGRSEVAAPAEAALPFPAPIY